MLQEAVGDVTKLVTRTSTKPLVLLSALLVVFVVTTGGPKLDNGPVGDFLKSNNNTITNYIRNNTKFFVPFSVFVPAILSIPKDLQFIAAAITSVWVLYVPEYAMIEYFIQSVGLFVFFRTRSQNTKFLVLVSVIIAWYVGYIGGNK